MSSALVARAAGLCVAGASLGLLIALRERRRQALMPDGENTRHAADKSIIDKREEDDTTDNESGTDTESTSCASKDDSDVDDVVGAVDKPSSFVSSVIRIQAFARCMLARHLLTRMEGDRAKKIHRRASIIVSDALAAYIKRRRAIKEEEVRARLAAAMMHFLARRAMRHARMRLCDTRQLAACYIQACTRRILARRLVASIRYPRGKRIRRRVKRVRKWARKTIGNAILSYIKRRRPAKLGFEVECEEAPHKATADSTETPTIGFSHAHYAAASVLLDHELEVAPAVFHFGGNICYPARDAALPPPQVCAANIHMYATPDEVYTARVEVERGLLYKSADCKSWSTEKRACPYGVKCRFRHPHEKIRKRPSDEQLCIAVWETVVKNRWLHVPLSPPPTAWTW